MANFNYKKYRNTADNLLTKYGQRAVLFTYNDDNTENVLDDTILAIYSQPKEENIPGSLIGTVSGMFTLTVGKNLYTKDAYIKWNGESYKIQYVNTTNLTDVEIVTQCLVSLGG